MRRGWLDSNRSHSLVSWKGDNPVTCAEASRPALFHTPIQWAWKLKLGELSAFLSPMTRESPAEVHGRDPL